MPKLKVFRTPIGFHDAYVAAPSQKAALAAWGSDANLFARGIAEPVDDPALTAEPLANPGKVIRRLRGSPAEQIAALPKAKPKRAKPADLATEPTVRKARKEKPRRPARPDRSKLARAEQALADAETRHRAEEKEFARRLADLQRQRRALEKRQEAEREKLERELQKVRARYEQSLRRWEG